jgi:RNA polymerase sigma-70 factor (ECF subfamily)
LRRLKARPPARDIPADEIRDLASSEPLPDAVWALDRRKQLIHRALGAMNPMNREVIILREMQGMSVEETARLLNVPEGTVKSRANRARIELAKKVLELSGGANGASHP